MESGAAGRAQGLPRPDPGELARSADHHGGYRGQGEHSETTGSQPSELTGVLKVHDYFSIEEGLGRYEWLFQRTNITLAVQQTFGLEFEVTRYPEQTTVAYNAASADSWAEIALVAKRLQTEEERVQEKEETKESVLKRLPR